MKNLLKRMILLFLSAGLLTACQNLPQEPTKTPTLSAEQLNATAQESVFQTQTQDAFLNPSATPEPTSTSTPTVVPTIPVAAVPPTATLPYLSIGNSNCTVNGNTYVPHDSFSMEVCFQNTGAAVWNTNYYCEVTRNDGGGTNPPIVHLMNDVPNGKYGCCDFNQSMAGDALGKHYSTFALVNDQGSIMANGYQSCTWNVQ